MTRERKARAALPAIRTGAFAATILAGIAALPAAASAFELEPYQMIRSLELVQDRIANGDEAAMPMQRKLLEMIDARLRSASADTFKDDRNFNALLLYAMSGGNPATIEAVVARLGTEAPRAALGAAMLGYVRGRPHDASEALKDIDPLAQTPELGAFLALVKGSVMSADDPKGALGLFDTARLLAPGTLVEEAALRRTIMVALRLKDSERFLRASEQYVRRFLHSPYASQFADAFVDGIVTLHGTVDMEKIANTVDEMDADRKKAIYLRLARKSAIAGLRDLTAFAARMADVQDDPGSKASDPRVLLYSSIAGLTSGSIGAVATQLKSIDRSRLSADDRELLDAASAIAREVTAQPTVAAAAAASPSAPKNVAAGTAPVEMATSASPTVPAGTAGPASTPALAGGSAQPAAETLAATPNIMDRTRKKLAAIDELLKETTE
jgi:chemotaxis protein MotC